MASGATGWPARPVARSAPAQQATPPPEGAGLSDGRPERALAAAADGCAREARGRAHRRGISPPAVSHFRGAQHALGPLPAGVARTPEAGARPRAGVAWYQWARVVARAPNAAIRLVALEQASLLHAGHPERRRAAPRPARAASSAARRATPDRCTRCRRETPDDYCVARGPSRERFRRHLYGLRAALRPAWSGSGSRCRRAPWPRPPRQYVTVICCWCRDVWSSVPGAGLRARAPGGEGVVINPERAADDVAWQLTGSAAELLPALVQLAFGLTAC